MLIKTNTERQNLNELVNNSIDSPDWKVELNTISKTRIDIKIIKIVRKCFVCSDSHLLHNLHIRQDDRVAKLFLPRFFCATCVNPVDALLIKLKPTVPKHLKDIRKQLNNE